MLDSRLPPHGDGPADIVLQESRQEIASRLSMKPETLSRILRTLSDSGAVVAQGRTLQIPSRARLLSLLDSTA
jgi:DNA-binding MarR family transcriptional regulator